MDLEVALHVDDQDGGEGLGVADGERAVVGLVGPGRRDEGDVELFDGLGEGAEGAVAALGCEFP
jgi:hypothetical protein